MLDWIVQNKDLFKTILIASGFGIGFFIAKGIGLIRFPFELVFNLLTSKLTFTNVVWGEAELYNNISKKILHSKKWMFRSFAPMYYTSSNDSKEGNVLSPGQGWFFCNLNKRLAFVKVTELNKEFEQQMLIHIIWFTRDTRRVSELMLELKNIKKNRTIVNYLSKNGDWIFITQLPPRNLSTVIQSPLLHHDIKLHYENMEKNSIRNEKLGIVNKSVKCFYGPPGTGKTSLAQAIAAFKNKDLFIVNTANVDDDTFIRSISRIDDIGKVIIFLEELDNNPSLWDRNIYSNMDEEVIENDPDDNSLSNKKKIKSAPRVSLTTMLNFLDGVLTPEGLDVIINTNHLTKLDPAVYRESRVNFLREVSYMGKEEVCNFIETYYDISLTIKEKEKLVNKEFDKKQITGSCLMEEFQKGTSYSDLINKL